MRREKRLTVKTKWIKCSVLPLLLLCPQPAPPADVPVPGVPDGLPPQDRATYYFQKWSCYALYCIVFCCHLLQSGCTVGMLVLATQPDHRIAMYCISFSIYYNVPARISGYMLLQGAQWHVFCISLFSKHTAPPHPTPVAAFWKPRFFSPPNVLDIASEHGGEDKPAQPPLFAIYLSSQLPQAILCFSAKPTSQGCCEVKLGLWSPLRKNKLQV